MTNEENEPTIRGSGETIWFVCNAEGRPIWWATAVLKGFCQDSPRAGLVKWGETMKKPTPVYPLSLVTADLLYPSKDLSVHADSGLPRYPIDAKDVPAGYVLCGDGWWYPHPLENVKTCESAVIDFQAFGYPGIRACGRRAFDKFASDGAWHCPEHYSSRSKLKEIQLKESKRPSWGARIWRAICKAVSP